MKDAHSPSLISPSRTSGHCQIGCLNRLPADCVSELIVETFWQTVMSCYSEQMPAMRKWARNKWVSKSRGDGVRKGVAIVGPISSLNELGGLLVWGMRLAVNYHTRRNTPTCHMDRSGRGQCPLSWTVGEPANICRDKEPCPSFFLLHGRGRLLSEWLLLIVQFTFPAFYSFSYYFASQLDSQLKHSLK